MNKMYKKLKEDQWILNKSGCSAVKEFHTKHNLNVAVEIFPSGYAVVFYHPDKKMLRENVMNLEEYQQIRSQEDFDPYENELSIFESDYRDNIMPTAAAENYFETETLFEIHRAIVDFAMLSANVVHYDK